MAFASTRGGACAHASQTILQGLAPNGGLFVPDEFPGVSLEDIGAMAQRDYPARAAMILQKYLDDFTPEEIACAVQAAYRPDKFDDPAVAPVKPVAPGTFMLELFHGPTLAFKDMALQLLPHLMTLSARKNGEIREVNILVATSGDTGKAALEGFKDVPGTSCTVFYPTDGVSDVQKLQMTTTGGSNTKVIALRGNFDDAQTGVKALFASADFAAQANRQGKVLSSANSINFGRLVPQIVYYFSAYADLAATGAIALGDKVNFVVPTGNFGNILAAEYARRMGLPVNKLICASNRNRVLTDFFSTGEYVSDRPFYKTTSPSMDILISSNLERLLFEAANRQGETVAQWMNLLKKEGRFSVTEDQLKQMLAIFCAGSADDAQCAEEIRTRYTIDGCVMDPHTAVASRVLREYRAATGDDTPAVIVSTASPYKFAADVLCALKGEAPASLDAFDCAEELQRITGVAIPPQVLQLRTLPVRHTAVCEKDGMASAALG